MKKFISIIMIVIFALSETGCSQTKQEIEKLSIVLAIGFDLNTAQRKYKADVFNFGEIISENYPDFWDKIKPNWPSIFPNLKIDVNVTSQVKRPGIISKPMK